MSEASDDVTNVIMLRVLVLLICIATGISKNCVSSMIAMVLFKYLKHNSSPTKTNSEKLSAEGGARS